MVFRKKHYSIPPRSVMRPLILTHDDSVELLSNNPNVTVKNGMCWAEGNFTGAQGRAEIKAFQDGEEVDSCTVTVVNWLANALEIETSTIDHYSAMIEVEGVLYGYSGGTLYSSTDGFKTRLNLGSTNADPGKYPILDTPYGYFIRASGNSGEVYRSDDLLNWELCFGDCVRGLFHMFDYYFNPRTGLLFIYLGEYSVDSSHRHKVYRGIIDAQGNQTWTIVKEFYSVDEYNEDSNLNPSARHVHVVSVDKRAGHVWVNTGDNPNQCHTYVSKDNGETWVLVGSGQGKDWAESQEWRHLSIWFTDDYVYWNMDSTNPQSIFRLRRDNIPDTDTIDNSFVEQVAKIDDGSHWFHCWAKDDQGNDIVIMASAAEGFIRDGRGRLWAIKETNSGEAFVREVATTPDGGGVVSHIQYEPLLYSGGYLYLNLRDAGFSGTLRCRFVTNINPLPYKWVDPFFA